MHSEINYGVDRLNHYYGVYCTCVYWDSSLLLATKTHWNVHAISHNPRLWLKDCSCLCVTIVWPKCMDDVSREKVCIRYSLLTITFFMTWKHLWKICSSPALFIYLCNTLARWVQNPQGACGFKAASPRERLRGQHGWRWPDWLNVTFPRGFILPNP